MPGSIAVLADRDTAAMFRLVGIRESFAVEDPEKGRELLSHLARDEKYALVMVTYSLAANMEGLIASIMERQERPLIAVIPSREKPISERIAPIRELIRRVVGVEVKMGT
ncbi:MAG: V-type ATP synthase subunit F [Candidatus Bathyarchaeia archaeon]